MLFGRKIVAALWTKGQSRVLEKGFHSSKNELRMELLVVKE